jgi:prepilin peptidase CpaA
MALHYSHSVALLVVALALLAAIADCRSGLIPNRLLAGGCLGLLLARVLLAGAGSGHLGMVLLVSLLGALTCGLIPLALYLWRGLGAGDVKLMAACGVGLGPVIGLEAELYAFGLGALYACARAAYGGMLWQTLRGTTLLLTNPLLPRRMHKPVPRSVHSALPFGPAICVGVLAAVTLHWSAL